MKKAGVFFILLLITQAWSFSDPSDPIAKLRQQLELFNKKYKRAKLDLLFNQPKYAPGDTAFVRALYVSALDLKPISGREIVYLDLFNQDGKRISHYQIRVENGLASNAIIISERTEPGIYLLVAYSDWMRNLDPSLFYRQAFVIAGKDQLSPLLQPAEMNLNFFPEGGSLVASIENNLVLQFIGQQKATVTITGGADHWGPVAFDAEGLAEIKMTPAAEQVYTATVESGNQTRKFTLPAVSKSGVALRNTGGSYFHLSASGLGNEYGLSFVLVGNGGILWSRPVSLIPTIDFALPPDLAPGIAEALVVDDNLKILARRLVMIPANSEFKVSVKPSRMDYGTRETGRLEVEVTDPSGNPVRGNFAVRIINQDLFQDSVSASSFGRNLMIYSDLSAGVSVSGKTDLASINRYLITQKSPWLDKALSISAQSKIEYEPVSNMSISGKAVLVETGHAVPDSTNIWFFLQRQIFGYEVTTGNDGNFKCPILFDFEGSDEVFYSATWKGADVPHVTFQWGKQDSVYGFAALPFGKTSREDVFGLYCVQKKVIDKSFSFFSKRRVKSDSLADPNATIEEELQGADVTLTIQDFIVFPTMVDLVREVLSSVDYRKIRGRDVIRVYTSNKAPSNREAPLFVIDGVMTKSVTTFLSLKPSDVFTIKVVKQANKLMRFGALGSNGVILVHTRNAGKDTKKQKDDTFPIVGMSPRYHAPAPSNPASSDPARPLMKPCLLWAPHQQLDESGRVSLLFNTSDDVGRFKIQVEGLTTSGRSFFAEETIQVKFNP